MGGLQVLVKVIVLITWKFALVKAKKKNVQVIFKNCFSSGWGSIWVSYGLRCKVSSSRFSSTD